MKDEVSKKMAARRAMAVDKGKVFMGLDFVLVNDHFLVCD